jgi:exo-beta-1,3-glucanase (GH17 family)
VETWQDRLPRIRWVAYSPSSGDPTRSVDPKPEDVTADLALLCRAGFTGLVTYSASGCLGKDLAREAREQGFEGLVVGVWDIKSKDELAAAKEAAKDPVVLGLCAGNEGYPARYKIPDIAAAIDELKAATGKPVTTTEEIDDYFDSEELLNLGDWIFPNAHPFFHQKSGEAAVRWTEAAYDELRRRGKRFVMFKEVGLPTAGDKDGKLSEAAQEEYYAALAKTRVRFVYFEAFDLAWKTHLPVEPHWGLFRADRSPKPLGTALLRANGQAADAAPAGPPAPPGSQDVFYVYKDSDYPGNHYKPTGYMGDCGDIQIVETCEDNPRAGKTCIRVSYLAKGKPPHECPYPGPCKWAGCYWQHPPNNWGKEAQFKGQGFDLSRYTRLAFWARADRDCNITFFVGGIGEAYGDSLGFPVKKACALTGAWKEWVIELGDTDRKHIIGGFGWSTSRDTNPTGAVFYLDEIRFLK